MKLFLIVFLIIKNADPVPLYVHVYASEKECSTKAMEINLEDRYKHAACAPRTR